MKVLLASNNPFFSALVKKSLSRFRYAYTEVANGMDAFQTVISSKFDLLLLDFNLPRMKAIEVLRRFHSLENFKVPPVIVFTLQEQERREIENEHFMQTEVISGPLAIRKFVGLVQQILHQEIRVACLGGGTGLFTLLSGLKTLAGIHITSIVSMSDDGGSTGRLRDMFGILPPGDVRRSLVALSTAPDLLNELMQYRFQKGAGLEGHNLGNLLLTAVSQMRGSMTHAVKSIGEILNIQGQVIPVTETINTLKAELENGEIIEGEHRIDLFEGHDPSVRIRYLWQVPSVAANPDALEALYNAHFIILGPGDLYTSLISNLIVKGVSEAIAVSRAKKIYICNVMTKPGETTDFDVADHVREIVKYLAKDVLDYILASTTKFSKDHIELYAKKNQIPVVESSDQVLSSITGAKIVREDLVSEKELVRHDSFKLASTLKRIIDESI
ncbi:MAG: YvcK family protein [Candidatus Omnitrophica bacterium]|nr:YvcK family protein [Candidatus Omnitrophota bacterium]